MKLVTSTFEALNNTYPILKQVKVLKDEDQRLMFKAIFTKTNLMKFEEKQHSQLFEVDFQTKEF